jgi:hypothetical protein
MRVLWWGIISGLVATCFAASSPDLPSLPVPAPSVEGPRLASAYQPYRLKLNSITPQAGAMGLILKTRVNGGPVLRLLLDSGAEFLVLDQRAARKSSSTGGTELDLVSAGSSTRAARMTTADVVQAGEITFHNCPMLVVGGQLMEGIDGVIPLSLFGDFLIHLDVFGGVLNVEPYPEAPQGADAAFVRTLAQHNLLFVPTRLEESHEGYLLLDTGSSYNVISINAADALGRPRRATEAMPMIAGAGDAGGWKVPGSVAFRFGGRTLALDPVVAVDLAEMSRRHQINVSGVIGCPALAGSVLTVNYRESLIRIQPK